MKKNYINLIIRIIGVAIILTGIISTIIPMFNFNVFTFNLGRSIVFAFGFTFVGIVLIVMSVIINTNTLMKTNKNTTEDIANKVKETITKEKESKKPKKCAYCGTLQQANEPKCSNCGATLDKK